MTNIVNLSNWLKSNDIFELKAFDHAYRLRKIAEAQDATPVALEDAYSNEAYDTFLREVNASNGSYHE